MFVDRLKDLIIVNRNGSVSGAPDDAHDLCVGAADPSDPASATTST